VRVAALLVLVLAACGSSGSAADAPPADARVSPCGLPLPGSRCKSVTSFESCSGSAVVTNECPAGQSCAPDPSGSGGAVCVGNGTSCGSLGRGRCSGAILGLCVAGTIVTTDCAAAYGTCDFVAADGTNECTTPCDQAGVDADGVCVSGRVRRCVFANGAYRIDEQACPAGTSCGADPVTGDMACVPGCTDVDSSGRCDGNSVVRCSGGRSVSTACGAGTTCAWGGATSGYACVPGGAAGARRVSGTVRFQDRPFFPYRLGDLTPAPARAVAVLVVDDATGQALATAATDEQGAYTLRFDASTGASVHVLAVAATLDPKRPARVLHPDGTLHGFGGPSFPAADASNVDLLVTEQSGAAEAMNLLDVATRALAGLPALIDRNDLHPITLVYEKGSNVGSATIDDTVNIQGAIGDDDGYDDSVIAHELGHTVENLYGRSDSPGGTHYFSDIEDPTLAWSEGWATYYGSVVRGEPAYFDSNSMGGLMFNIDTGVHKARGTLMTQNLYELMVSEILWDLGDDGPNDDDPVPGPHHTVTRVEPGYLAPLPHDRGVKGVDLVDFLDGYLVLAGASVCAGLEVVIGMHNFPYDGGGPVPCP
jgi:hypothetical protein